MRGYGQSDAPPEIASYSIMHLVGDIVGLAATLGQKQAIIVGHDWGATVAWQAALLRPDVFPAIAAMSVPFRPRGPAPPLLLLREQGLYTYYQIYYQDVGVADAEYDRDPRSTLRRTFFSLSGDAPRGRPPVRILQPGKGALDNLIDPERLPPWLTEADLDYMTADLTRTGFRPGLNWYRNVDRNWELLAPRAGAVIRQRALFIAGTEDHVIYGPTGTGKPKLEAMAATVPNLERPLLIEGAGHYIQQERPQQVNAALIQFLRGVATPKS
jgi:pimeloyl-ACP methyl ester carboxylesterase